MADVKVQEVQQWLNDTFPTYFKYVESGSGAGSFPIEPDGYTGSRTMKALVMAIQIHYNLSPVDGVWGNATSAACPVINSNVTDSVIIRIVQGGFYCKGYEPGGFDGGFGPKLALAIRKFKEDLGITTNSNMEQDVFKALLNTDPTVITSGGSSLIRIVQKYLNGNYYNLYKNKLGFIPTGGKYERKTSKAIIYAMQKEIGTTADGSLGPNTFNKMPSIEIGCTKTKLVKVLQAALICNGYSMDNFDGIYNTELANKVSLFQMFMCLNLDSMVVLGKTNRRTWGALLWSKGDTDRKANAGDCRQRLDSIKATSLYNSGYRFIGRYVTKVEGGYDKNLTSEEIRAVLDSGLKIFPIFQESNNTIEYFNHSSGYLSCFKAFMAATNLRIPLETTIYFTVDFDALENQAQKEITEYFNAINLCKRDMGSAYQIGIYSARNTCNIICDARLATSSFVSNMSTGYSGNLGYLMPQNWAFDQFKTGTFTASDGSTFDLDSVVASNNAKYFETISDFGDDYWDAHKGNIGLEALSKYSQDAIKINNLVPYIVELENVYWSLYPDKEPLDCAFSVLYYLWHNKYGGDLEFGLSLKTDSDFADKIIEEYPDIKNALAAYIEGNYNLVKDGSKIEDSLDEKNYTYSRIFELPHLAVVISAYLELKVLGSLLAKEEWFGWAGDLATGLKEVKILKDGSTESTPLEHARDRIGKMEIPNDNPYGLDSTNDVQMNFCDIIADIDSIGISVLVRRILAQDVSHTHLISDAFYAYYGNYYTQRNNFLLNDINPNQVSVNGITNALIEYLSDGSNALLMLTKADMTKNTLSWDEEVINVCSRSLAEIIIHDINNY